MPECGFVVARQSAEADSVQKSRSGGPALETLAPGCAGPSRACYGRPIRIATVPVPVAALLERKVDASGKRVGVILSGGNVDLDRLPW